MTFHKAIAILFILSLLNFIVLKEVRADFTKKNECSSVLTSSHFDQSLQTLGVRETYQGMLEVSAGESLFVRLIEPSHKPRHWAFLLHGILDHHLAWRKMALDLLEQGIGVILVDLPGHGLSLQDSLLRNRANGSTVSIPYELHYTSTVRVLHDLLLRLQSDFSITKPIVIGHSMGGALAMALAAEPEAHQYLHPLVIALAPYVYRLERRAFELLGFKSFVNPLFWMPPQLERLATDPVADSFLSVNYRVYVEREVADGNTLIDAKEARGLIGHYVKYGIAITKGLRELDATVLASQISEHFEVVQIVGDRDELLDLELQKNLADALKTPEFDRFHVIKGGSHRLILEGSEELSSLVQEHLRRHGLVP